MDIFTRKLDVHLADGTHHTVSADQRDFARLETAARDLNPKYGYARYLAWSVMTREGLTAAKWPEFNERECVQAMALADDEDAESEGEQSLSPGHAEALATS